MTGAFLGCALHHIPGVVDGFISIVAALCACRLCPHVRDYLFLSHASYEVGYRLAVRELDLEPCLLLDMRLGRGQRLSPCLPDFKGGLRCDVRNGEPSGSGHQRDYLEPIRASDSFTVPVP